MIYKILSLMIKEEVRLNTSFTNRKGFYAFPVLIALAGFFGLLTSDNIIGDTDSNEMLRGIHIGLLFYGLFAGSLAFFGNDFLERIIGSYTLIIGLSNTQPLSHRKSLSIYFAKEIVFYSFLTFIPLGIGMILGSGFTDHNPVSLLHFLFSIFLSFTLGLSLSFLLSSLYRITIKAAVIAGCSGFIILALSLSENINFPAQEWYGGAGINYLLLAILLPLGLSTISSFLIGNFYEPTEPKIQGFQNRFLQILESYNKHSRLAMPAIAAKERIDLMRSKTGVKMFFSFVVPLSVLTLMNWFLDEGVTIELEFNTLFYGTMVGFFGTMIYSWLNSMDNPGFYSTLPVTVPDVIRARLLLFVWTTWWIPLIFISIIAALSGELRLLPLGILVMIVVGLYIVNYTAWTTGLRTNSALFDAVVFIKFFFVSVPPMVLMTILSLSLHHSPSIILIAVSFLCLILLILSLLFNSRIEAKWARETFD